MASEVYFTVATRRDAELLAATMQPADVAEVRRGGMEPLGALLSCLERSSVALSAWRGDELGCVFGVWLEREGTLLSGEDLGCIWSLTAAPFERYPVAFCRAARRAVRLLVRRYGDLFSHVDAQHRVALRFMRFLGADLADGSVPCGPLGQPFVPICFRRTRWAF